MNSMILNWSISFTYSDTKASCQCQCQCQCQCHVLCRYFFAKYVHVHGLKPVEKALHIIPGENPAVLRAHHIHVQLAHSTYPVIVGAIGWHLALVANTIRACNNCKLGINKHDFQDRKADLIHYTAYRNSAVSKVSVVSWEYVFNKGCKKR